MPERADGYYWVLLVGDRSWRPAEWQNGIWAITGWDGPVYEGEVALVGAKLEPPPDA